MRLWAFLLTTLVWGSAAEAQRPMTSGAPAVFTFEGFGGAGFMPPTVADGALDSHEIIPVGFDSVVPYGGTCTSGDCARGVDMGLLSGLLPGIWAVPAGRSPASADLLGIQSPLLGPGGVQIRVVNADSAPLNVITIDLVWWGRALGVTPRNSIVMRAQACDGSGPRSAGVSPAALFGVELWQRREGTFVLPALGQIQSGEELCIDFLGASLSADVVGIESITVRGMVTCGDHRVEEGEECDEVTTIEGFCRCDSATCTVPRNGTSCEDLDGDPCTAGLCESQRCVPVPLPEGPTDACEDGLPCTVNGCTSGECRVLGLSPGLDCCIEDVDCVPASSCERASCNFDTRTCLRGTVAGCDAGPLMDAGLRDANVTLDAPGLDAPVDAAGLDAPGLDAPLDGAALDAPQATGISFGGGGGCRCAAGGRAGAPALAVLVALFAVLAVRRAR